MRKIKEKGNFAMSWVLGVLSERKKMRDLRECWLMGGMVLDWYLVMAVFPFFL